MMDRRVLALCLVLALAPAVRAQVPPAQPDGGMGGASSAGGSSGGGMTRDDEQAHGVEAGHEGQPHRDAEARREGRQAVKVRPSPDPRSPASGGVPDRSRPAGQGG